MHIQISTHKTLTASPQNGHEKIIYSWALVDKDGDVVCQGPRGFHDEPSCRSQIARAKKSMKGALRYKVVSPS